jgi:hypothetical protein
VADLFTDGQLYVNLRGYDMTEPITVDVALSYFLRALGVPGLDNPSRDRGSRAAARRSLLADRKMLVVLDNARRAEQVRALLPRLRDYGRLHSMISRSRA